MTPPITVISGKTWPSQNLIDFQPSAPSASIQAKGYLPNAKRSTN